MLLRFWQFSHPELPFHSMKIQSVFQRAICAGALLVGFASVQKADAATFRVSSNADSGPGTLRQAILDANTARTDDTIILDDLTLLSSVRIDLKTGELRIANRGKLTIEIQSAARSGVTIRGGYLSRIFNIEAGANLTLNRLTLDRGFSTAGGAVFNSGQLTANNSYFYDNFTDASGNGGAIYNAGRGLTLNNTTFYKNTTQRQLGAQVGDGGAIYNAAAAGPIAITGCIFTENVSTNGGAIYNASTSAITINKTRFDLHRIYGNGGVIACAGNLTISNSALVNNYASREGGAIYNWVTGTNIPSFLRLSNSTISYNSCGFNGGAIYNAGSDLTVESCTLTGNDTDESFNGGGIFHSSNYAFTLNNSIVAGNTAGTRRAPNIYGNVTFGDYNLVDDTTGTTLTGTHNIVGKDPKLGGLIDNGGPTPTHILLTGSPAIDAGKSTLTTDQRGNARPINVANIPNAPGGNGSDIGAVEVNEAPQSGMSLVVNKTDDHNDGVCGATDCTLREALTFARANRESVPYAIPTTITFDLVVFASKQTLEFAAPLPELDTNVSIIGPSNPGSGVTLSSTLGVDSALHIREGWANLSNLTLRSEYGDDLLVDSGTVTVNGCLFEEGRRGIKIGDESFAPTSLTVKNSTFTGQQDVAFQASSTSVTATLDSCTITRNVRGILVQNGTVHLKNSLVVGNDLNIDTTNGKPLASNATSIVTGTAEQAGLGTFSDRGGPTFTYSLLPGSPARDAGATTLTTDQRGVKRDSKPDIGAYEANAAPRIESLSPLNATDKVGTKRTFSITASDLNGVSNIREFWLMVNERLSWNGGATLIYVPTNIPTDGLLYLRAADGLSFLPPMGIGAGASTNAALDNGAVNILARDVKITTSGNSITLNLPLTIRDGLVGVNRVFGRVVDTFGATDPSATPGDDGYRRFGNYTVTPQFSGATNSAPTLSRLTPTNTNTALDSSGFGPVQNFTFYAVDPNGTGDIESIWLMANKQRNWTNSATFIYTPRTRRLTLRSDDGNTALGGGIIGTDGIIENSQVRVDLSKVRVLTYGDGKTFGIILPLQAKRGLLGQNTVWLRVQDNQRATAPNGDAQGYVQSGTWNVGQGTTPRSTTSTTISAAGS
ncbi:CSLREA domain-containing protein [bacterium]|nr:MAG: CSLREA domain-containing protein [bacterium]